VLTLLEDLEEAEENRPHAAPADGAARAAGGPRGARRPRPTGAARRGALPGRARSLRRAARGDAGAGAGRAGLRRAARRRRCRARAPSAAQPRLACLCLLEGGASAAATRYLLRRARRRLPGVPVLALAWRPAEANEGPLATGLRAEGRARAGAAGGQPDEAVDLVQETAGVSPGVRTPRDGGAAYRGPGETLALPTPRRPAARRCRPARAGGAGAA
jgi:hypothetical protein